MKLISPRLQLSSSYDVSSGVADVKSIVLVFHAPTKEASGLSRFIKPAGFHEAAVASSATAMNADCPSARAPEPIGSGAIGIFVSAWAERLRAKVAHKIKISITVLLVSSSFICLLCRSSRNMCQSPSFSTNPSTQRPHRPEPILWPER